MFALESVGEVVTSGSMLIALPLALLAGLISFFSPCVLPLLPGYVGLLGALTGSPTPTAAAPSAAAPSVADPDATDPDDDDARPGASRPAERAGALGVGATAQLPLATAPPRASTRRVTIGAILFVAGFSAVWIVAGVAVSSLAIAIAPVLPTVLRVAGVVVILLGLAFVGWIPFLQAERRLTIAPRAGLAGAPVLGVVFGLGWAPCIGPTLAAVLTLALSERSATRGLVLTVAYCLGLGIPFVVAAVAVARSARALAAVRRHARAIQVVGGVLLVALGVLLVTGLWNEISAWLQGVVAGWGMPL
ncbi:Cytochrome c-type biogenesis protein CcdA (DsbD analog) [Actinomycetales bacterium JB111]|nr:Cytochrome c-type biogenesis protein CcdA (DsbD analog) [Actinomycetales bacterium JB111]